MKTYQGNYDGTRKGLVRAKNQKQAAEIAGSSLHAFRQYWRYWDGDLPAHIEDGKLYTKPYDLDSEWAEGRCPLRNTQVSDGAKRHSLD